MDPTLRPRTREDLFFLRTFMGLLMNHEVSLEICGLDLAQAYEFALDEHNRLETLNSESPGGDQSDINEEQLDAWHFEAEQRLLEKVTEIVHLLKTSGLSQDITGEWISMREKLRVTVQSHPQASVKLRIINDPVPIIGPANPLSAFGVTEEELQWLHGQLKVLNLPHPFVFPFAIFLAGLFKISQGATSPIPAIPGCPLQTAARAGLRTAVDFAREEEAQCLARSRSKIPGDTEYQCLFMGVAYVTQNPPDLFLRWKETGNETTQMTTGLFAMGSLAFTETISMRWTRLLFPRLNLLTEDSFGSELAESLQGWVKRFSKPIIN